jgi:protein farnesyltransferase subunit beta
MFCYPSKDNGFLRKNSSHDDEGIDTHTSREQCSCELDCASYLLNEWESRYAQSHGEIVEVYNSEEEIMLVKDYHIEYLMNGLLRPLPSGFVSLDASRPWMCYWIVHALQLLGKIIPNHIQERIINTLMHMQNPDGGFGGGPSQLSHAAPTYAAVLCLCSLGTDEALGIINKSTLYNFFMRIKDSETGAFRMHVDGEIDTRGTYTVLAISRILNMLTDELVAGVSDYIKSCMSYEGGFGGEPGNEAHGGYNFCALAGLIILNKGHEIDIDSQEFWLLHRQLKLEGGFQGRTNKLVDSCYSFWQGSALAIVNMIKNNESDISDLEYYLAKYNTGVTDADSNDAVEVTLEELNSVLKVTGSNGPLSFDQHALQKYILHCAQQFEGEASARVGGMRDKPGKSRDFYHTCYSLSGLSIAQHSQVRSNNPSAANDSNNAIESFTSYIYGDVGNMLTPTSAVFNITLPKLEYALQYFKLK